MPFVQIHTNKTGIDAQKILRDLSALLASILNKSEKFVMVEFIQEATMMFAGSDDPLAYMEVKSIGLPVNETKELSKKLCDYIEKALQVKRSRVYIEFVNADRALWGWNGTTFER